MYTLNFFFLGILRDTQGNPHMLFVQAFEESIHKKNERGKSMKIVFAFLSLFSFESEMS